jgi:hypothetical protein
MTYVYERTNYDPILAAKDDFLSYLPRYVGYWREFKERYPERHNFLVFDVSFLDARDLKNFLLQQRVDIETFAGVFYGLTLFSQVVHYYQYFIWDSGATAFREENEEYQVFQTVTGVLSTAWTHVCPAVMPSMLMYIDPDYANGKLAYNSISAETALWERHGDIFDRGAQLVLENIDYLTYVLLAYGSSNRKLSEIFFNEHAGLRLRILTGSTHGRILNHSS